MGGEPGMEGGTRPSRGWAGARMAAEPITTTPHRCVAAVLRSRREGRTMGKARTGARVPYPLVAVGSALVFACLAPGHPRWSDASEFEREEPGPEATARVS